MGTVPWSPAPFAAPVWRRQSEQIILSWNGEDIVSKEEHARGRWFAADMDDPAVRIAAEAVARRYGWMARDLVFSAPWKPPRESLRIRLPRECMIQDVFDVEIFLHCIATEGGSIPAPPVPRQSAAHARLSDVSGNTSAARNIPAPIHHNHVATDERAGLERLSAAPVYRIEVPGLIYIPDFLQEAEEKELVGLIDEAEWLPDLKRRVQHYGWRYDYKGRQVDPSMRLGPLPTWAAKLAERLHAEGCTAHLADQVIVNEYIRDQGISKHIDCVPCFADGIAMISLLESWEMIFRKGNRKVASLLERRSVTIMTGDARYQWQHEIPSRLKEPDGTRRSRRISITFRKVNAISA